MIQQYHKVLWEIKNILEALFYFSKIVLYGEKDLLEGDSTLFD